MKMWLQRLAPGALIRGRVSKVSVLPRGVRSVVIHFGIDEPGAKDIVPGTLFEGRMVAPEKKRGTEFKGPG